MNKLAISLAILFLMLFATACADADQPASLNPDALPANLRTSDVQEIPADLAEQLPAEAGDTLSNLPVSGGPKALTGLPVSRQPRALTKTPGNRNHDPTTASKAASPKALRNFPSMPKSVTNFPKYPDHKAFTNPPAFARHLVSDGPRVLPRGQLRARGQLPAKGNSRSMPRPKQFAATKAQAPLKPSFPDKSHPDKSKNWPPGMTRPPLRTEPQSRGKVNPEICQPARSPQQCKPVSGGKKYYPAKDIPRTGF